MNRRGWILVVVGLAALLVAPLAGGAGGLSELHLRKIVLEPPSAVIRGEVVAVHAWVINTGERPAGEFKAEFFWRRAGGDESWTSFHTVLIPNLAPSQADALEIKDDGIPIALDTSPLDLGVYEIRVVADSNNQIPEGDEMNNELATTLTLLPSRTGLADLQAVSIAFDPASPASGEIVVVSSEIRNTGNRDAGPFRVTFLVDGVEFDGATLEGLAAGSGIAAQGALDPYALGLGPGSHAVRVRVDGDALVEEQDEANNELTASLTLQGAELRPLSLQLDRSLVRLDERVTVSARVKNVGRGEARSVEVAFLIGGVRFALVNLGPLGPGDEATAVGELLPNRPDLAVVAGLHELRVTVDPNGLVPELDEANNDLGKTITVFAEVPRLAELHPESLELNLPSPVELGKADAVTICSLVVNTGKALAKGFSVEFVWRAKGTLRWEPIPCRDLAGCGGVDLAPGAEIRAEGTLPLFAALPGIYEVRVVVDPHTGCDQASCADVGRVAELDEHNNDLVTTLTLLSPRLPDLSFDPFLPLEIAPTPPVKRGQTLRLAANVLNLGDVEAGPFEVEFSYRYTPQAAPQVGPAGIIVQPSASTRFAAIPALSLGVGKETRVQALLETIDLRPGTYVIRAEIDPVAPGTSGTVRERNEVNNLFETQVLIQGPDLTLSGVEVAPPSAVAVAQVVKVRATALNTGVEAAGRFSVGFSWCRVANPTGLAPEFQCVGLGAVPFTGIAIGSPVLAEWTFDTSSLEPGEYVLRVVADSQDEVAEQDELNNEIMIPLTVGGVASGADLAPTGLIVDPEGSRSQASVAVRVTNLGTGDAGPFIIQFLYAPAAKPEGSPEAVVFDTVEVAGLAAGATTMVRGTLKTSLGGRTFRIIARVDAGGAIQETDEGNNTISEVVTLQ